MNDRLTPHCYLNGDWVPLAQASVSVLDRGFIFGDGIYEVVPVYSGVPFRAPEHYQRLVRSLKEVGIPLPFDEKGFTDLLQGLIQHPGAPAATDHTVYLQITRGVAPRVHAAPPGLTPTVFAMLQPLALPNAHDLTHGVRCVSAPEFRWDKGHIKSTSLLGAVLAREISVQQQATETILFRDDWLTEGSASNVWIVQAGRVLGVPKNGSVLEGIRYGLIESLCQQLGLPFELRPISRAEVFAADELMISSASKEVLAVTLLDDARIGPGVPGPIWQRLHAAYQAAKAELIAAAQARA